MTIAHTVFRVGQEKHSVGTIERIGSSLKKKGRFHQT